MSETNGAGDTTTGEANSTAARETAPRDIQLLERLLPELQALAHNERHALITYLYSRFIGTPPSFMSRSLF